MRATFYVIMSIMVVFLLSGCRNEEQLKATEARVNEAPIKTILALGDSLTAGYGLDLRASYPALLEEKLQAHGYRYRVINGGVSGETTEGTLARLDWALKTHPDIVILEIGVNDGFRDTAPEKIEKNLRKLVDRLLARRIMVVFAGMKMLWKMGPEYGARFDRIYPRLARDYFMVYFPFFLKDVALRHQLNLPDGLHPNRNGHQIISDNIFPYVVQAIHLREQQ